MSVFRMPLPDVGEGVAEAEIVSWLVAVGDEVTPDTSIAEVLTDKATVEISAPVHGTVTALHGEPGDVLAVGSILVEFETAADGADAEPESAEDVDDRSADTLRSIDAVPEPVARVAPAPAPRPLAAPAVRARAAALGLDLARIPGTGPEGRVTHADLDRQLIGGAGRPSPSGGSHAVHPEAVRGVRRQIAQRLAATWSDVPHITYVDAVDVTELERLRAELNRDASLARLTILPFLARAMVLALRDQPRLNAHYEHAAETLTVVDAVHIGIATQTDDGLRVPVVRHAEERALRDLASEIARVSGAARDASATREELSGSTITITSLGALGGLVTTPLLNAPEVAIVGVNKMETRPVWTGGAFVPRQVINLSCSFDHRMVDGWDAATFVQRIKTLLESPALLFVDGG